ncbi:PH domain-containing protein [Corynebacterium sp.]|uniref:PH domain-containing protein n=1 Tax=Corynebacterium sp. TaxID=1720 RepID=UPI0026DC445A|nr:PH domain-containing protein [Corynebacterium sp.]MDO5076641.1 PH domain-containing protein [Corynebacterium sp.]
MSSKSQTFRPERTHLLAAGVLFLICLLVLGAKPEYLFWLPVLPLVFVLWVLRTSTTVDDHGIHVRYAFAKPRSISWDSFAGIGFEKARCYARTVDGESITLPAVSFNSLPNLSLASRGRIPDALTAGREATHDKVVVIHRDGRQVLQPREDTPAETTD